MQNESELWYPIPNQSPENAQDFGTDPASDVPSKVQLPHNDSTQKSATADDQADAGPSDSNEFAAFLHDRIDRDERARYLAREAQVCNEFDDAVSAVFSGAEATSEARQAFARFNPRDPDPQAFEFRNFVSPEYEKYGYF